MKSIPTRKMTSTLSQWSYTRKLNRRAEFGEQVRVKPAILVIVNRTPEEWAEIVAKARQNSIRPG